MTLKTTRKNLNETNRQRGLASSVVAGWVTLTLLLALPGAVTAQEKDPFKGALFGAELVMSHQEAIGLTSDQRGAIVAALQRTQSEVVPWQLSLSAAAERLLELLRRPQVDSDQALGEVEEVLRLENQVKLEQVRLLIEIKNLLTRDQQRELDSIRARRRGR